MNESTPLAPGSVLEAALYARDLLAAEQFYHDVIGLRVITRQQGRNVFFGCGKTVVLVFNPEETARETVNVGGSSIPKHGSHGAGHIAFAVDPSTLGTWRERLWQAGVEIETEIAWPQGGHSLYCRDPAGNSVELATRAIWPQLES